jgi:hypothetical protein
MTDVVIADLNKRKSRRQTSVRRKRVRNAQGKIVRVLSVDANSPSFIDDLTEIFRLNVRRARAENKRLFGSPDGPPPKKAKSKSRRRPSKSGK